MVDEEEKEGGWGGERVIRFSYIYQQEEGRKEDVTSLTPTVAFFSFDLALSGSKAGMTLGPRTPDEAAGGLNPPSTSPLAGPA